MALSTGMRANASAITLNFLVQSKPFRVKILTRPLLMCTWARYPSNLISWIQRSPAGGLGFRVANWGGIRRPQRRP
jgi:hypothetical protein